MSKYDYNDSSSQIKAIKRDAAASITEIGKTKSKKIQEICAQTENYYFEALKKILDIIGRDHPATNIYRCRYTLTGSYYYGCYEKLNLKCTISVKEIYKMLGQDERLPSIIKLVSMIQKPKNYSSEELIATAKKWLSNIDNEKKELENKLKQKENAAKKKLAEATKLRAIKRKKLNTREGKVFSMLGNDQKLMRKVMAEIASKLLEGQSKNVKTRKH